MVTKGCCSHAFLNTLNHCRILRLLLSSRRNNSTHLGDADPLALVQVERLHAQPLRLVGVNVPRLVLAGRSAGGDGFLETAAALELQGADALFPLVELDLDADDVLGLFELVSDLAPGVFELLAAAPAGLVFPAPVAREGGLAAVGVAASVLRRPFVVGIGPLLDGGPLARVDEGCEFSLL